MFQNIYTKLSWSKISWCMSISRTMKVKRLMVPSVSTYRQCLRTAFNHMSSTDESNLDNNNQTAEVSALYIPDRDDKRVSLVSIDLNWQSMLHNLEELEKNLKARKMQSVDLQRLKKDFLKCSELRKEKLELERRKEESAKAYNKLKEMLENDDEQLKELLCKGKFIKEALKTMRPSFWQLEESLMYKGLKLPNSLHHETPLKDDEIIEACGTIPSDCKGSHHEIAKGDIIFSKIGPQAYFMRGRLAVLEQRLIWHTSNLLEDDDCIPFTGPDVFRSVIAEGCNIAWSDSKEVFTLQNDYGENNVDKLDHLAGNSQMYFAAFFTRMMTNAEDLPVKLFAVGRHYSPSSSNKHNRSLFDVSQSTQVNAFGAAQDESEAFKLFQDFQNIALNLLKDLNIPLRHIRKGASELEISESIREEIQCWSTSKNKFITLSSISLCNDFISRRLMMRHKKTEEDSFGYLYTVYSTVLDVPKVIACLLECGDITVLDGRYKGH